MALPFLLSEAQSRRVTPCEHGRSSANNDSFLPSPLVMSPPAFRRNESNRLSSNSPGSSASTHSTYPRTLTSTARQRKLTVAACRALRAQITRFEDAFIKVHGRPPKGANDRAPLATTYAQYREWKRAIRADAASRIQAMYRGARVRMILVREPRFKRIVERRKGRVQISNLPVGWVWIGYP